MLRKRRQTKVFLSPRRRPILVVSPISNTIKFNGQCVFSWHLIRFFFLCSFRSLKPYIFSRYWKIKKRWLEEIDKQYPIWKRVNMEWSKCRKTTPKKSPKNDHSQFSVVLDWCKYWIKNLIPNQQDTSVSLLYDLVKKISIEQHEIILQLQTKSVQKKRKNRLYRYAG